MHGAIKTISRELSTGSKNELGASPGLLLKPPAAGTLFRPLEGVAAPPAHDLERVSHTQIRLLVCCCGQKSGIQP